MKRQHSPTSVSGKSVVIDGIEYRRLERTFDSEALFLFNKTHGSSPHNFMPEDGPIRAHFAGLGSGETFVWAAFSEGDLVGLISGTNGGEYWSQTGTGPGGTSFIDEFVVHPGYRGKGIGKQLTRMTIDPMLGIFDASPQVREVYTTVHVDNIASRTAFIKSGYEEVMTYRDAKRSRNTTVLKFASPHAAMSVARTARVVGVQSGNAVDGIDVGIFDIEPPPRHPEDPHKLIGSVRYKTLANKTFAFTPERRQFVLDLRSLSKDDGAAYARGNYELGRWFAEAVNTLVEESGIDKSTLHLVSSHGQTITGHPHWEFGDLSVIAQLTGITVAGDFRPADVAAGGNGTPVTCTYDSIMLRPAAGSGKWRVAINIGGTSSMTFLPPWPTPGDEESERHVPGGLDPGLGVFFMDLCVKCIDPTLEYDDKGEMARSGTTHEGLLEELLKYKYWDPDRKLPIGVGPEDFSEAVFAQWRGRAQELGVSDVDLLSTLTEVTAKQLALAAKRYGGPHIANGSTDDVLLRGGVCANTYFVERLTAQMSEHLGTRIDRIKTLEDLGIDEKSVENAQYAIMGYLCCNSMYNFVPSCTGASRHVVGGRIAPGFNFGSVRLLNP